MKKDTFRITKKTLLIIIVAIILILLPICLILSKDSKIIDDVKKFIKTDTKVLYISTENKYSNYLINILDKYDSKYLYINISKLSNIEKIKLEKISNTKYLSNTVIIFENGKVKDIINDYSDNNKLNKFLIENEIIPEVIGDNKNIIESIIKELDTDFTILYLPYKFINGIDNQNEILKSIANEYNANYKMINAYLLSKIQQEKLNSLLEISTVENQIILLIKDKKIIGNIREIGTYDDYYDKFSEFNFIYDKRTNINEINYTNFNNLLESKEKNVILISKNDCKYCEDVMNTLSQIVKNYDVNINYINIGDIESELSNKIKNDLIKLGYSDAFTMPIVIMTELGNLIDYVIGSSEEKYFIDIFTENGIIK